LFIHELYGKLKDFIIMEKTINDQLEEGFIRTPLPSNHINLVDQFKRVLRENNKSDLFLAYQQYGTNWFMFKEESLPFIETTLVDELKRGKFPSKPQLLNCIYDETGLKISIEPGLHKNSALFSIEIL
jgi:hypothetical protein